MSLFLSNLTEDIEKNLTTWLTHEKGQLRITSNSDIPYKLSVSIEIILVNRLDIL